jgi:hypothetical protein
MAGAICLLLIPWRTAENDLFLPVNVDLQDTDDALYALATVNGVSGSQIAVAIEDRWLLISSHLGLQVESEGHSASPSEQEARGTAMRWIEWDDLYSVLKGSKEADDLMCADHAADPPEAGNPVKVAPVLRRRTSNGS